VADSRRARFDAEALGYLDELFRVARRVSGDAAAAEDLVQDTYLEAWRSFDRFEPGSNCRAWLYKILFRVIGSRRRELKREMAMFDDRAFDESQAAVHTPAGGLNALQIERAFAAMPIASVAVIQLVDVEGLSYREAAAALDVPVGTIMSRLHRGRAKFRRMLAPGPSLVQNMKERP
jgi:RNA polymerase sigma-70 factor, ECF subfamily